MKLSLAKIKRFRVLLRVLGAVAILAILSHVVSTHDVLPVIKDVEPLNAVVAMALFLGSVIALAFRWRAVLQAYGYTVSIGSGVRSLLLSGAANMVGPGFITYDSVRVIVSRGDQPETPTSHLVAAVLGERFVGLGVLLMLGALAGSVGQTQAVTLLGFPIHVVACAACLAMIAFVVVVRVSPQVSRFKFLDPLVTFFAMPRRQLATVVLYSVLSLTLDSLVGFFVARGLRIGIGATDIMALMPWAHLASLLPLSLAGIGPREGTLVYFLRQMGFGTSIGAAFALTLYLCRVTVTLGGAFLVITMKRSRRTVAVP